MISQHLQQTSHNFNGNGFKLLDVEKNKKKRDMSEILRLKLQSYSMNEKKDIARLSNMYNNVLHKFENTNFNRL